MAANSAGNQLYQALQETSDEKAFRFLWTWSASTICEAVSEILEFSGGSTALILAVEQGSVRVVEILISFDAVDRVDVHTRTALMLACLDCNVEMVNMLLHNYADPNSTTNTGKTPLMHCIESVKWDKAEQMSDIITLLIEAGGQVNAATKYGITALYMAVQLSGLPPVVRLLLEKGANPNSRCYYSEIGDEPYPDKRLWVTPLVWASWLNCLFRTEPVYINYIQTLVQYGALPTALPEKEQDRLKREVYQPEDLRNLDVILDMCNKQLFETNLN